MNKILFSAIACFLLFTGKIHAQLRSTADGIKLETTLRLIDNLYVRDVQTDKLTEAAIRAMLRELDPHSVYLDNDEVKSMNEPLQGNFEGIGVSFNLLTDTLYIVDVISGGPSQKVGILPGDKIIYVNDTLIAGVKISSREVMKKLRGDKGTEVKVKVKRRGSSDLIEFRIIRDKIPLHSIDATFMVADDIGYIRLSRFGATSHNEFLEAVKKLRTQGMKRLIFDLTGNGGGILQTATDITDEFLQKGQLIVYTEGENQPRFTRNAKGNGVFESDELVVLVDETSASASEILSGALQDWDRAVIVGRRTFGKGLVQRQFPLPDGTMIRLTVAKYYTPTGRSIQKPYEAGNSEAYNRDVIERFNHGELMHADSIHFPDSLQFTTLINRRVVYGGGGIMPDYFVPIDTGAITPLHRELIAKGVIFKATLAEVDHHRKQLLNRYPTVDDFKQYYHIDSLMVEEMKKIAQSDSIKWDKEQFEQSKKILYPQLKALIARDLYEPAAYYRIIIGESDIFQEGLKIISDRRRYHNLLKGVGSNIYPEYKQ